MEKWEVGLAHLFKERNNPKQTGITIGKVISGLPDLTVSLNDEIILDTDQLVIANRLYHMHRHDEANSTINLPLVSGDKVILVPATSEQIYYVIDKVGE